MKTLERVVTYGRMDKGVVSGDLRALLANVSEFLDDDGKPQGGQSAQIIYNGAAFLCPDPPADDGTCCETVMLKEEDESSVIAFRDLRLHHRVNPAEGDVGIAHYGGGFLTLKWDDDHKGSLVVLMSTRLDDNGEIDKSHGLIMDPSSGNASIQLLHLDGACVLLGPDGDVSISAKGGENAIMVTPDGISFAAKGGFKMAGGALFGDVNQAEAVALYEALSEWVNAANSIIVTLAAAVNGLAPGSITPAQLTALGDGLTKFLGPLGKATTLKASPV